MAEGLVLGFCAMTSIAKGFQSWRQLTKKKVEKAN
jgi:hypothetical protein